MLQVGRALHLSLPLSFLNCTHPHTHTCTHTHTYMYIFMYTYRRTRTDVPAQTYTYMRVYTFPYTYTYTQTHTRNRHASPQAIFASIIVPRANARALLISGMIMWNRRRGRRGGEKKGGGGYPQCADGNQKKEVEVRYLRARCNTPKLDATR